MLIASPGETTGNSRGKAAGTQQTIELLTYGAGNMGSIQRCLERMDVRYTLVDEQQKPSGNRPLIMPGVGAFGAAMERLRHNNLHEAVISVVKEGTPFLGICVGLQVLLEGSEESPGAKGLGLVAGQVKKFQVPQGEILKVPQIGWNYVTPAGNHDVEHYPPGYVYFVNSYYPQPDNASAVLYEADYGTRFCAAIQQENITAFQFHPEKSGTFGQDLIRRWLNDLQ